MNKIVVKKAATCDKNVASVKIEGSKGDNSKGEWIVKVYRILGGVCFGIALLTFLGIIPLEPLLHNCFILGFTLVGVSSFAISVLIRTLGDIAANARENVQNQKLMCEQLVEMNKNMTAIVERMTETKNGIDGLDRHLCAGINWFGENLPKMQGGVVNNLN